MKLALAVPEIAELTGLSCEAIYKRVQSGDLARLRGTGRAVRVPTVEVERYFGLTIPNTSEQ